MQLLLSGSGPASGFPVPGCFCAACSSPGRAFPHSAAQPWRAPARLELPGGWALSADPSSDAALLITPGGRVAGLVDGQTLALDGEASGWQVRAADHRLLLVSSPAGPGLLWAPQAGLLPDDAVTAVSGAAADLVVIGPTPDGRWIDVGFSIARLRRTGAAGAGPAGADDPEAPVRAGPGTEDDPEVSVGLDARPAADLGILAPGLSPDARLSADVVIVGLGHRAGPGERLRTALPHWRAVGAGDGEWLDLCGRSTVSPAHRVLPADVRTPYGLGPTSRPGHSGRSLIPGRPRRTLLLGGASSGKSDLAELLLAADPTVRYLATGARPDPGIDAEWADRVRRHQQRRPDWWPTVETDDLPGDLGASSDPVLLDSVGSWLAGVLDRIGCWQEAPGWPQELARRSDALVEAWRGRRGPVVAVSEETGLGIVPATPAGRRFRDELGRLNQRLADESEAVALVVAGRLLTAES